MNILLIEDEKITRITLTDVLREKGWSVEAAATGKEGLEWLERRTFDVVVTDLRLPKMNGLDVLKHIKEKSADTVVIMMTAYGSVETAVQALKAGAFDYLTKPFSPDKLHSMLIHIQKMRRLQNENAQLKQRLAQIEQRRIIGNSPTIRKLIETIRHVARHDSTVLITGESGTGKELVARALHQNSLRKDGPFVAVNCSAIPESLLESELFGYEKGAFTGAQKRHIGYFERAHGGTLFIDDIDDLSVNMQLKLLRVLQERELIRVGGWEVVKIDVRVIAATKVDLKQYVQQGKFRQDLFYRLNIIPLNIPPLRERREDIPILIEYFLKKQNALDRLPLFNQELLTRLMHYDWPGNVRELENFVERFVAFSGLDSFNPFELLPARSEQKQKEQASKDGATPFLLPFNAYLAQKEREIIEWALKQTGQNVSKAAELLGLPRTTLRSKMNKLGL